MTTAVRKSATHGGARPGAGPKFRDGEPTRSRSMRWTATELARMAALTELLGEDSDSDTMRRAFEELAAKHGI